MARIRGVVAWGLVALLCVGLGMPSAEAATSTGALGATADTMTNQNATTANNGSCLVNVVNARSTRAQRVMVRFDVSTIPSDAAIKTANLSLVQTAAGTDALRTFGAHRITTAWSEGAVCASTTCASPTFGASWSESNLSNCTTAWTTAGGDFNSTATASVVNVSATSGTTVTWGIKADVQAYVLGTAVNNGTLIKDSAENAGAANTHQFGMKENGTASNKPSLTVTYLRQVTNLTASASSNQVVLNWTLPTPGADYNGVLIVRKATTDFTSNFSSDPVDGTAYVAGNTIGTDAVPVVANLTGSQTSYTDSTAANDTTYFYRVYARDSSANYSQNTVASSTAPVYPKVSARPADGAVTGNPNWSYATGATSLAPPGLTDGGVVVSGSNDSKLHGMSASTGTQSFTPFATGNAIQARPPVIPSSLSTTSQNVAYVTSQDGKAYAVDTSTGALLSGWTTPQLGNTPLQGGAAVWLQAIQTLSFPGKGFVTTPDMVVVGTKNTTAPTTSNKVYGLHAGGGAGGIISPGGAIWTFSPGNMDIIASTPLIDYFSNTIWVSSLSNGGTQPSLWKLNAADGTLVTSFSSLGGDITSSPVGSLDGNVNRAPSFIYVGTDAGALKAIKVSDNTISTHTPLSGTGAIKGSPLSFSFSTPSVLTPDTIVFSRSATVHAVQFNGTIFSPLWTTTPTGSPATISAPIDNFDGTKVYVGASDGKVHRLTNILTLNGGQDEAQVSTPSTQTVGDPSFDITLGRTYVGAADAHIYSFTAP